MGKIIVNQDLSIHNDNVKMFEIIEWDKDEELLTLSEEMKNLIDKFSKKGIEIGICLKYQKKEIEDLTLTPQLEENILVDNYLHLSDHQEETDKLINDFFNKTGQKTKELINDKDSLRVTVKKSIYITD